MDSYLASYMFCHCQRFMTVNEKLANRHLPETAKVTHGRIDVAAQEEANSRIHLRNFLSADPEVLELARDGVNVFVQRTAQRVMAAHSDEPLTNPALVAPNVARTPKGRQCRFCRYDWREC